MAEERRTIGYLTDHFSDVDEMRFSRFRPALEQILRQAETPLTVGVFGTWGAGKTSLLKQLQRRLEGEEVTEGEKPAGQTAAIRTIWFTAWKYGQSEALWRAFILRVLDAVHPRNDKGERLTPEKVTGGKPEKDLSDAAKNQLAAMRELAQLEQIVYSTVTVVERGGLRMDGSRMTQEAVKLAGFLPLHLAGLGSVAEAFNLHPDLAAALQRDIRTHTLAQLQGMEQFVETFGRALKLSLGENGRLVVFVDDLDRCLPERAIEVLEAIKLFLEVTGAVFVLGVDEGVIARGIRARYRALFQGAGEAGEGDEARFDLPITGSSYLQKLIQIPFYLPPLTGEDLERYIETKAAALDPLTRAVFARGLHPNPRQVKRALNIFTLLDAIRETGEESGELEKGVITPARLAKTVVIQAQYPKLYEQWRTFPLMVQQLEERYRQRPSTEQELVSGVQARSAARPAKTDEEDAGEVALEARAVARPASTVAGPVGEGDLLEPYLTKRREYMLLERLLIYPQG